MSGGLLSKDQKRARATEACRKWRAKNPDYYKEYYKNNRNQYRQTNARFHKKNAEKRKEASRLWKEQNQDKERATQAIYRTAHREAQRIKCREWHTKNAEKVSIRKRAYQQAYPEKGREISMRRHTRKLNAMPKWITEAQHLEIKVIYAEAARLCLEVDHVIPLQGRNVCGLHVPSNLQLLTKVENVRKHNRFDTEES